MDNKSKLEIINSIRSNVAKHGYHLYVVSGGGPLPRFAYTIGGAERCGSELILAGASLFLAEDLDLIFSTFFDVIKRGELAPGARISVGSLGYFFTRKVDWTWSKELLLGALDYYGVDFISSLQIVPDADHWTLDIPDLEKPWSAESEPVWRWLYERWDFLVPAESVAATNLRALQGGRINEAARWEAAYWELFVGSGPDISSEETRIVPLATLLGIDETLIDVVSLEIGHALWRDAGAGEWHQWGSESD